MEDLPFIKHNFIIEQIGYYKGVPYIIAINENMFRVGYIGISNKFMAFLRMFYKTKTLRKIGGYAKLKVHGGVTFDDNQTKFDKLFNNVERRWIGFDCAHYGDAFINTRNFHDEQIKSFNFVFQEIRSMVYQLLPDTEVYSWDEYIYKQVDFYRFFDYNKNNV